MKTGTKKILPVLKIVALLGGAGYSIFCGSILLSFIASFRNVDWAKRVYAVDMSWFNIREFSSEYFSCIMLIVIALSALKALVWFQIADLLIKFEFKDPFSRLVANKLERIAYILLAAWITSIIGRIFINAIMKTTGITVSGFNSIDEYFFISGIVYIISQIFKRGIEMQEENKLTV